MMAGWAPARRLRKAVAKMTEDSRDRVPRLPPHTDLLKEKKMKF